MATKTSQEQPQKLRDLTDAAEERRRLISTAALLDYLAAQEILATLNQRGGE